MKSLPIYPFLTAVYPVLAGAAANMHLGVSISDVWVPLLMALAGAGIVWLATGTFLEDVPKRAFTAFLLNTLIFWYGYFFAALGSIGLPGPLVTHETIFPLAILIGAIAILVAARTRIPSGLAAYLNIALAILVLFPSLSLARGALRPEPAIHGDHLLQLDELQALQRPATRPDIYFIVLDAYTGSQALRDVYGFDNSDFETDLRDRGFVVPSSQRSNYVSTFLTLASILNWDYVDRLIQLAPASRDWTPIYPLVEYSRTLQVMKHMGYQFVFFPTTYPMTYRNRWADLHLPEQRACCGQLLGPWLRTTVVSPIYILSQRWLGVFIDTDLMNPEPATRLLWKFEQLARVPSMDGPNFVFAHLVLPHEPFQFRKDCSLRQPVFWPHEISPSIEARVRAAYIEQVKCTNRLVVEVVDRLLTRSDRRPVILLQSDHGYGRFDLGRPLSLDQSNSDQVDERTDAFAAYYLPGLPTAAVPEGMTPVNLFRLVLSAYFGMEMSFIPDKTYWSSRERPYAFTELRLQDRVAEE